MILDSSEGPVNTQFFENSPLASHAATSEYENNPDKFFSAKPDKTQPDFAIITEKPEHRIIVYLRAQNLSKTEIAQRTGYTIPWISQITRQPWFKQRLVEELKSTGRDKISDLLQSTVIDSIETLVDLRDNGPAPVRKAAASDLLDRYLGKPVQTVMTHNESHVTHEDVSGIDKELLEVNEQLKSLTGHP